jgi:hypothetical protein
MLTSVVASCDHHARCDLLFNENNVLIAWPPGGARDRPGTIAPKG